MVVRRQRVNKITSRRTILLEKLLVSQLVKKLTTFSRTRGFITSFTTALPHQTDYGRSFSILSSHLCVRLTSALFFTGSPTRTFYLTLLFPHQCYIPPNTQYFLIYDANHINVFLRSIKNLKYSNAVTITIVIFCVFCIWLVALQCSSKHIFIRPDQLTVTVLN